MSEAFEKLGIIAPLLTGLQKAGIAVPTEIQEQVIPLALMGKDIIGQSPTGTGKTLAYLLPLFQKIDAAKREPQAMILAPTHELAIQIQSQIEMLANNSGMPVASVPIIGNVNITHQVEKLRDKPHIIVGLSGRILELIQKSVGRSPREPCSAGMRPVTWWGLIYPNFCGKIFPLGLQRSSSNIALQWLAMTT